MENGNHRELVETVSKYVKEVRDIERQVKEKEEELKRLNERKKTVTEYEIPDLMMEAGTNMLQLLDDTRIEVKSFWYARVDKQKSLLFFNWLRENGHGGLVKSHFNVLTRDQRVIPLLSAFVKFINEKENSDIHIDYEIDEDVHWKTLEKWFQEVSQKAQPVNTELFINHIGRVAKIKDK